MGDQVCDATLCTRSNLRIPPHDTLCLLYYDNTLRYELPIGIKNAQLDLTWSGHPTLISFISDLDVRIHTHYHLFLLQIQ